MTTIVGGFTFPLCTSCGCWFLRQIYRIDAIVELQELLMSWAAQIRTDMIDIGGVNIPGHDPHYIDLWLLDRML